MSKAKPAWFLDLGLFIARVSLGLTLAYHGSQKLFGAFGGPGIDGFTGMLKGMNVPAPQVSAYLSAGTEFFGGLLLAIGLLARIVTIPIAINMAVAFFMAHHADWTKGELAGMYLLWAIALFFSGPGGWSADAAIAKKGRAGQP